MSSKQHLAAILRSKGAGLEIVERANPIPGPDDILIEVKSIAINPVDWYQRELGFMISHWPTVIGSDIAGTVLSVGASVPASAPALGTRVAAFATSFNKQGEPDYGAFQKCVLVPAANVVPLPDAISFNEGSLLPMAVATTWAGFYTIGVPRDAAYTAADKKGLLVWGAASSVGSAVVQVAKSMGFIVYATASEKHHEYIKSLGASKLFDYKAENVAESIVKSAKEDGVVLNLGYDAVGQQQSCMEILKEFKGEGTVRLASAPLVPENLPKIEGVEVKFVSPSNDPLERTEHFSFVFTVWLKDKLQTGEFVPSPKIQVVEGGLASVPKALDEWRKGVSGVKIVVEV